MKILDYTALQADEFYLPSPATENNLMLLPKWSLVYVFCLRVIQKQQMTFDQCHDALMKIWNNVPVCLVTSDMAGNSIAIEFSTGIEPIRIPNPENDNDNTQLNFFDPLGVYSRQTSSDPNKRQVVFVWVDKIMDIAGKDNYDILFAFTVLHEMMHVMFDIDAADKRDPKQSLNADIIYMSRDFFFNREDVVANALAVLFLMKLCPNDHRYAVDYVQNQPQPYSQIFDVMRSEHGLLIQASQWLLYKKRYNGLPDSFVYGPEEVIEIPYSNRTNEYEGLTSFIFPSGTSRICYEFLKDFVGLRSVTIPEGVVTIDELAFDNCANLRELMLPSSLNKLAYNAFKGCGRIEHISVNETNEKFYSSGECVVEKGSDVVVLGCSKSEIPEICSGIGEFAFADCKDLTKIHIPEHLYVIRQFAFTGCDGLKQIVIPKGVEHICENAFYSCENLQEVIIKGAPLLYDQCFAQCRNLQKVWGLSDKRVVAAKNAFLMSDITADFEFRGGISMVDEL